MTTPDKYFLSIQPFIMHLDIAVMHLLRKYGLQRFGNKASEDRRYYTLLHHCAVNYIQDYILIGLSTQRKLNTFDNDFVVWAYKLYSLLGINYETVVEREGFTLGELLTDEIVTIMDSKLATKLEMLSSYEFNNPFMDWECHCNGDNIMITKLGDRRLREYNDLKQEVERYKSLIEAIQKRAPWLVSEAVTNLDELDYGKFIQQEARDNASWLTSQITKSTK